MPTASISNGKSLKRLLTNSKRKLGISKPAPPTSSPDLPPPSEDPAGRPDAGPSTKRKAPASDALQWRPVSSSGLVGLDEGGGMMMLEELDDVGVEWEEGAGGTKVARLVAKPPSGRDKGKRKAKDAQEAHAADEITPEAGEQNQVEEVKTAKKAKKARKEATHEELPSFSKLEQEDLDIVDEQATELEQFDDSLLPAWSDIAMPPQLKRSLHSLGFAKPTAIQKRALPSALSGRDVVGVAETGSGKTLAYSLPILAHVLSQPPTGPSSSRRDLSGLILCPTRELALQVVEHLKQVVRHLEPVAAQGLSKGPPRISIGSVIGGLSAQKQKRILDRGADVLVATPGRLWDLLKADEKLAADIRRLQFLVIDEADRMIETGHFAELENIVRLTQRQGSETAGPDDDDPIFAATSTLLTDTSPRADMQTFVFSATMSKDLQQNLKRRQRAGGAKNGKKATALEDLVDRLDFRDPHPEVIDLSPEGGVVASLKESMVECVLTDKDLYLYYFLLRYPGRSMVFVGSIDGIRRLVPLFEMLQLPVYPLHSQLQQKQRLKNLDRFKSSKNGILIATDVAARGLDIPQVDHVVHFNLPRTADAYIHRSGRTARAQNPGFALQLVCAEERGLQRSLMKSLNRDQEVPELPIEAGFMPKLKERIRIARAIEKAQHEVKKEKHDQNWLREAAEAMDIDIDPDIFSDLDASDDELSFSRKGSNESRRRGGNKKAKSAVNVSSLKAELRDLLSQPLLARGVSVRYPTSGSKVIIDDILRSTGHGTLLGAGTGKAWDEVGRPGKKLQTGSAKRKKATAA